VRAEASPLALLAVADGEGTAERRDGEEGPGDEPLDARSEYEERPPHLIARLDDALAAIERAVLGPVNCGLRRAGWAGAEEYVDTGTAGPEREPALVHYLRRPLAGPVTALAALMLVYIVVFGTLTYRQQSNFGTFGFDMGIYDQAIWLMAHFKAPFVTIRGLNYFGNNVDPITVLFIPFYWLGAGPHFLYVSQTLWLAAGAVPIWLLGRDRFHNGWLPMGLSAAYLLYPSTEWINFWQFRPDAMMITPLMFGYWLATKRRWGWFWVATLITLSCKEDAGLAVFALGVVLWLKQRQRAWGLVTAVAGAAWFFICTKLIIPLANGGSEPFYLSLFPGYGNSVFAILGNLVLHPSRWIHQAVDRANLTYYAQLFWPVGMVALLEPAVLLVALPQLFVNVISAEGYTNQIEYYYTSLVLAGIFLATVEACARWGRTESGKRLMVALVFAAALASNVAWSPSPISIKFHDGEWAGPVPQDAAKNEAIRLVPPSASVSATYDMDAHMSHRTLIYEFPDPWLPANWGLPNKPDTADPSKVDWMVLNTEVTGDQTVLYQDLMKSEFKMVFDKDDIIVLHRARPGVPNDHNWP